MNEKKLADVVIEHLNDLVRKSNGVRADIAALIERRVPATDETFAHPTIQCDADTKSFGVLGLLNSICAEVENGYGPICAVYDDDGVLLGFARTSLRLDNSSRKS